MNKNVKRVLAGLTMMVSVGLIAGCGSSEQVGYVDMQKIMTDSQKGQDTRSKLEAKYNEINARLAQEQSAGQDANAMMQSKQKAEQEMQVYQQAMINDFRNSVDTNVQAIAKEKNITAVVEKNALISGGVDLTEDVLTKMGKAANKEQGAATSGDANANATGEQQTENK
ncbi:OmpH family outer membrane protein [Veillonella sp.]|uniref:OmpH family outer membrane protein n=1 Tax=Veillonella sp. TaxID=1926307 RepID=UPI0025EBAF94|nr:OmpH family outer membrane protein [Veillonella sp.]